MKSHTHAGRGRRRRFPRLLARFNYREPRQHRRREKRGIVNGVGHTDTIGAGLFGGSSLFLVTSFGEGQDTGAQPPRHIIG
jgi:hypothetical protein